MIWLNDISLKFGDRWILRNIQLEIKKQESLILIGPSGSGKSVFLKIVAGLIEPTSGSVRLGTPNIGMLFQKNALFDSLTVEENLLFPLKERKRIIGKEAQKRTQFLLEAVGLKDSANLFPDEISGGMQKRLGIARALVVEPEIILYDDPTAGLDPITSRIIADLIITLKKKYGSTLLIVTNDIQRAYQLGDRICLLANGQFIEGGDPQHVKKTQNPELKQFIYGLRDGPLASGLA